MNVRYTEDLLGAVGSAGGVILATQVVTDNRTGFTVGAGIEFGLVENLSDKIEYDFYDFGSKSYNFNAFTPVSVSSNLHTIIVGLNYKFKWSAAPRLKPTAVRQNFLASSSAAACRNLFSGKSHGRALANAVRSHYVRPST